MEPGNKFIQRIYVLCFAREDASSSDRLKAVLALVFSIAIPAVLFLKLYPLAS